MSQSAVVTGTVAAYAGGSIVALFIPEAGLTPKVTQASANLDASGNFSINAWNNADSTLAPSMTQFTIALGRTKYTVEVNISSSSQSITSALSGAPAPAVGVPSVNSISGPVTIAAGAGRTVTTVGSTITIS